MPLKCCAPPKSCEDSHRPVQSLDLLLWFDEFSSLLDAPRFLESYPLLITNCCRNTHFYDEFWRKTTNFCQFHPNFWKTHPYFREICKRDPCLENFAPRYPPIWAAHTRTLNMLCYPWAKSVHYTTHRYLSKVLSSLYVHSVINFFISFRILYKCRGETLS